MTNDLNITRELAEFLEEHVSGTCTRHALPRLEELRALLAADPCLTAAQSELAALREELAITKKMFVGSMAALGCKTKALIAAEQRNAKLEGLVKEAVTFCTVNDFPMSASYFAAALNPTESGASNEQ